MKHTFRFFVHILFLSVMGASVNVAFANSKVAICHIPPGNPENAHTITVSESAVPAHMAHGDALGECDAGGGGGGSSSTGSLVGASFVICDDREGETGRNVSISVVGRVQTVHLNCD